LLGIINDILDLSKIEAGKMEIEQINFRLDDLVNDLKNLINVKAEEKGVDILIDVDERLPEYLIGDSLRLNQALNNLGSNAVKFTDTGGKVCIKISLLEKTGNLSTIHFSVQDTGIGISEEQQSKLFNPFTQADTSTTRQFGGTGLGLVISSKIVEIMGGKIEVDSKLNVGSTFSFTVKLKEGEAQGGDNDSSNLNSTEQNISNIDYAFSTKVLLVEDNEINQEVARELLTQIGLEVEVAENGKVALELLNKETFDGVLMDCQMPVMDGYEATRQIRKIAKFEHLPILAMTANAMKGDREKVLQAGMDDHIAKPINPQNMFAIIEKWIKPRNNQALKQTVSITTNDDVLPDDISLEVLTGLDGVDYSDAPLHGRPELYLRLLRKFHEHEINFEEKFKQAFDKGDLDNATVIAHALKGTAGNLGMKDLYQACLDLEFACREKRDDIAPLFEDVMRQLNRVFNSLDKLF